MKPELNISRFESELYQNILPFWMHHAPDLKNGGFVGGLTNDLTVRNDIPRTAVAYTRFLWTFSHAFIVTGNEDYLEIAHRAYHYIKSAFWDNVYGGLFWSVDRYGQVVRERKHSYAQAFGVYGLSEYFKATGFAESLDLANGLFTLLEAHAFDHIYGGYFEGCALDWSALPDMRLGEDDLNCQKSMNTMLHILEAYTNLVQVSSDKRVKSQLLKIIPLFQTKIIGPDGHFRLYFNAEWVPLSDHLSYGHDIEGSWLLIEAADAIGDDALTQSVSQSALQLARAVLQDGIRDDNGIIQEATPDEITNPNIEWWSQAEAVVGFFNAFQMTGDKDYQIAAENSWKFINDFLVDRQFGGWIKRLLPDLSPDKASLKAGPWEGPYHEARMYFEMTKRLGG
jgi:mannobiose 2-epimerase